MAFLFITENFYLLVVLYEALKPITDFRSYLLLGGRSVYHPLDDGEFLNYGTTIHNISMEKSADFRKIKRQTKAAEFYNIKTRLYLGLFLLKTLLQPTNPLAAISHFMYFCV